MKRSGFTEEQIIGVLKEHLAGVSAAELCRKHGISDATFDNWRSKYGGMEVSEGRQCCAIGQSDNGGAPEAARGRECGCLSCFVLISTEN